MELTLHRILPPDHPLVNGFMIGLRIMVSGGLTSCFRITLTGVPGSGRGPATRRRSPEPPRFVGITSIGFHMLTRLCRESGGVRIRVENLHYDLTESELEVRDLGIWSSLNLPD